MVKIADSPEDKKEATAKKKANPKKKAVTGVWPCKINGCNKQFAREADLKRHQRTTKLHSTPGLSVACPQCDATFTRTDALRRHQKSRHNGVIMEPTDAEPQNGDANGANERARSLSRSRSATPAAKKERTVNPPSNPSPHMTHPPTSGSYYRQHTTTITPYMPPPRPILDPHYSSIGPPTSATRLGAGEPPLPGTTWTYPPPPTSWPEGPAHLSGPAHPFPYASTYYPHSYYRHPPHPPPSSDVARPSPTTTLSHARRSTSPGRPDFPQQLDRSRHVSPGRHPSQQSERGENGSPAPQSGKVSPHPRQRDETRSKQISPSPLAPPAPPSLLPISTSSASIPVPVSASPSTTSAIDPSLSSSAITSPITSSSNAVTTTDPASAAVAIAAAVAAAQAQGVAASFAGVPLEVTQAAVQAVLESARLAGRDVTAGGKVLSGQDAIPGLGNPGVADTPGSITTNGPSNGIRGRPPTINEYTVALAERQRALVSLRQEEEEEEEVNDGHAAMPTTPASLLAPLPQTEVATRLGISTPEDRSMLDVFAGSVAARSNDDMATGPDGSSSNGVEEQDSHHAPPDHMDSDGDAMMDYAETGPDTSSASIGTIDSERRDEESVEEHLLMDDGEPMLNPADILTSESLASPPPS